MAGAGASARVGALASTKFGAGGSAKVGAAASSRVDAGASARAAGGLFATAAATLGGGASAEGCARNDSMAGAEKVSGLLFMKELGLVTTETGFAVGGAACEAFGTPTRPIAGDSKRPVGANAGAMTIAGLAPGVGTSGA